MDNRRIIALMGGRNRAKGKSEYRDWYGIGLWPILCIYVCLIESIPFRGLIYKIYQNCIANAFENVSASKVRSSLNFIILFFSIFIRFIASMASSNINRLSVSSDAGRVLKIRVGSERAGIDVWSYSETEVNIDWLNIYASYIRLLIKIKNEFIWKP